MARTPKRTRGPARIDGSKLHDLGIVLNNEQDQIVSPNEAGRMLGITGEAVKQWVYQRRLPAVKQKNGYWRIRKSDLLKYLENREVLTRSVVILSEDNAASSMITDLVKEQGHEALLASSHIDGILKVQDRNPEIIVVDLEHSRAWDFMERLRAKPTQRKPCLLLVAPLDVQEKHEDKIMKTDAKGICAKPLERARLKAEMALVLGKAAK